MAVETRSHLSLAEVGTEEFLQKLTSQITEIVSAKITQGEGAAGCGARVGAVTEFPCPRTLGTHGEGIWARPFLGITCHMPPAKLQVPGGDSDEESKTPSASPWHGRSRPSSSVQESSSESEDGDSRGEVL